MTKIRLAQGRSAEIYTWGDNQVLKLFRGNWPEAAEREAATARIAYDGGVPTPRVDAIIEVEGRSGIIFERVTGRSMLHLLVTQPWRTAAYAPAFAKLHRAIHQVSAPLLRSLNEAVAADIGRADTPPDLKQAALKALQHLAVGDQLCHGDFHPDNVLVSAQGAVVIDWNNAVCGPAIADVAQTSLLLRFGAAPTDMPLAKRLLTQTFRQWFYRSYLHTYLQGATVECKELAGWEGVLAVARLGANLPGEREPLTQIESAKTAYAANAQETLAA